MRTAGWKLTACWMGLPHLPQNPVVSVIAIFRQLSRGTQIYDNSTGVQNPDSSSTVVLDFGGSLHPANVSLLHALASREEGTGRSKMALQCAPARGGSCWSITDLTPSRDVNQAWLDPHAHVVARLLGCSGLRRESWWRAVRWARLSIMSSMMDLSVASTLSCRRRVARSFRKFVEVAAEYQYTSVNRKHGKQVSRTASELYIDPASGGLVEALDPANPRFHGAAWTRTVTDPA